MCLFVLLLPTKKPEETALAVFWCSVHADTLRLDTTSRFWSAKQALPPLSVSFSFKLIHKNLHVSFMHAHTIHLYIHVRTYNMYLYFLLCRLDQIVGKYWFPGDTWSR